MNKFTAVLFICLSILVCSKSNQSNPPNWLVGEWKGTIGYEHDTTEYLFILKVISKATESTIMFPAQNVTAKLYLDTLSDELARFHIISNDNLAKSPIPAGILVCTKFNKSCSTVHIQFYPAGRQELWLSDAAKIR
jgi:hypothetical protein